jgi:hypothetical protein
MSTTAHHLSLAQRRAIRRAVAVAGLLGIALIHLLDLQSKLHETPYLGLGYLGIIASALVLAEMLVRKDDRRAWAGTLALAVAIVAGFVINRTVGMPGAMDDIGNWLEPLGLASLFVEGVTGLVAALALAEGPAPTSAAVEEVRATVGV